MGWVEMEKILDELEREVRQGNYPGGGKTELEIIRLARLGLWAEKHGKPALENIRDAARSMQDAMAADTALAAYPKEREPMIDAEDGCQ